MPDAPGDEEPGQADSSEREVADVVIAARQRLPEYAGAVENEDVRCAEVGHVEMAVFVYGESVRSGIVPRPSRKIGERFHRSEFARGEDGKLQN